MGGNVDNCPVEDEFNAWRPGMGVEEREAFGLWPKQRTSFRPNPIPNLKSAARRNGEFAQSEQRSRG